MTEFLLALIKAVALAAIPVCGAYAAKFLRQKSAQIAERTESDRVKDLLAQVTDAVTTAVTYTNQTMVDALRRSGGLTAEDAKEAMRLSLNKALSLLSEVARNQIEQLYGDITAYLTSRIEAEVKTQKMQLPY